MTGIRILVGDDHPICRQATRAAASTVHPDAAISEAGTFRETIATLERAERGGTDLILLDLGMPDLRGLAGLIAVANSAPKVPILVVTGNESPGLSADVRAAGARGFISKSAPIEDLLEAIRAVSSGRSWFPETVDEPAAARSHNQGTSPSVADRLETLTAAERRVLGAICDGSLNKQVAHRLDLSEITVKQHVKAILRKLQVANRTQAAILMQFRDDEVRQLR